MISFNNISTYIVFRRSYIAFLLIKIYYNTILLLSIIRPIAVYRWSCRISWDISVRPCRPRCPAHPSATGLRRPRRCPSTAPASHGPWTPCEAPVPSTRRWRTSCNICRPSSTPFATCPWARRPVWHRSLHPPAVYIVLYNIIWVHKIRGYNI